MTKEQKNEYAYSYIEDMDIETKINVAKYGLNTDLIKIWLVNDLGLECSNDDIYDLKCWIEDICKYDVDDYIRENSYQLQNKIESVINNYDYIPYDKIAYILSELVTYYLRPENYD